MVAIIGLVPMLAAEKAGIVPVPAAAKPILGVSFVQEYEVEPPVFVVAKFMAANVLPLHIVLLETVVTLAEGFTVIVNVIGVPLQLLVLVNCGVTVTVATTGAFPKLVAVKEAIFPVPEAANPMDVIVLVQL